MLKVFFKGHISFVIYHLVLVLLSIGLISESGTKYLHFLALVTASFNIFYWLGYAFFADKINRAFDGLKNTFARLNFNKSIYVLFSISVLLILLDMYYNNGLPGFKIFSADKLSEIAFLRENIHSSTPKLLVYLSGMNMKTILPFMILFFLVKNDIKWLCIATIIGALYAFGMMQKSFIVFMFLPAIIYAVFYKKWIVSAALSLIIIGSISTIIGLSSASANDLTAEPIVEADEAKDDGQLPMAVRIMVGMSRRVFIVPGKTVAEWFSVIPEIKPFLYGKGYPVLYRFMGGEYINYNRELYKVLKPEYVEKGLIGSVNCATFMREYSNFGWTGLILSSFLVALTCLLLNALFIKSIALFLSINLFNLIMLSSTNLFIQMFSGGWALMLLLFVLYDHKLTKKAV